MSAKDLAVCYQDVLDAQARIQDAVLRTPASHSRTLSSITGADVYLKFECFQFTAAFKERGALNRLSCLSDDEKERGVVAMSAGNHAQGVAYHATKLDIPTTIVMPKGTPFTKVKRTEELGATVVLAGDNLVGATLAAREIEQKDRRVFIHPFDDPLVIAGQGTIALEFLNTFPDLEILAIPIGGGGLISGIAVAAKAINPDIRIIGVQSAAFPSMKATLSGETIAGDRPSIAEGIAVKTPGHLTREIVRELVEDIVIVSESDIEDGINLMMEVEKVVAEGAGAAGLAALLAHPETFKGAKTGIVICGGNIDPRTLASCVMRGLARDGRITRMHIDMPDIPGGLAKVATIISDEGGNVIEVIHEREFAAISVKHTELKVVVETKDRPHADHIMAALRENGFGVERFRIGGVL